MENETKQNSEQEQTQAQETRNVEMSQEALNALIDKKYAKGAEKAKADLLESLGLDSVESLQSMVNKSKEAEEANKTEVQKLQEQLEALNAEKENYAKEALKATTKAQVSSLSAQNGIQDVEVFEMLYTNASQAEGFNQEEFINKLKETKAYLFGKQSAPKTDTSSNRENAPTDLQSRIKNAKTRKELDALYAELNH